MPQEAPDNPILVRNRSASGGMNTFSSPLDIRDDQVVEILNGLASIPGIRGVRPGTSLVATGLTYGPIMAAAEFVPSTFIPELLVITPGATHPNSANLQLWKWDGTSPTFSHVGALTGMTSATMPIDIVVGLDLNASGGPAVALIANKQPINFHYYYNGSALVTGPRISTGAFPYGSAVGRMFFGGRSGVNRGKLFFSDVGSFAATGFSTTSAFTMGGGSRQEIICLKDFRSSDLIVFMQDRIEVMQLDGSPYDISASGLFTTNAAQSWVRGVIDRQIGCGSRRTVQTIGQDLLFMDQHAAVRSLARTITDNSQGTRSLPVSAPIQSWIDRVNPAALDSAEAASFDRYYVISLPIDSATSPSHTFVYDSINQSWVGPWDGPWAKACSLVVATLGSASVSTDKDPTLYIGASTKTQGEVYRSFVGTGDDGAPIVYQETTRRETFGTFEARKMLRRARLYAFPSPGATMSVEARVDGGQFKLVAYADLSGSSPQLPLTLPVDLSGSGVVEKVMSLESGFENALDLQYRFTCTAPVDLQLIGHTTQAHLKEVNWQVT